MPSKIIRNTLTLTLLQFSTKVAAGFWIFYLARRLGVAQYGVWSNILAWISIFGAFQGLGTSGIAFKEISQKRSQASLYWGALLWICGLSALLIFFCIMLLSWLFGYSSPKFIMICLASFSFIAFAPALSCQAVLYGFEKIVPYHVILSIGSLFYFVLGIVLVEKGAQIWGVLFSLSASYLLVSFLLFPRTIQRCGFPLFHNMGSVVSLLLRQGFPLALISFLTEMTLRIDRILIERILGETAIGIYQASANLIQIFREIVLIPFVTSVSVYLYTSYAQDRRSFAKIFERSNIILVLISLAIIGPFVVFPEKFIEILYGEKFIASAKLLPILIWSILPFFLLTLWQILFIVKNETNKLFLIYLCGTLLTSLTNLIFLERYGLNASAWIAVITPLVLLTFLIYSFRKDGLFNFSRRLPKIFVSFFLATALTYLLRGHEPVSLGLFLSYAILETIVYVLFLILFRTLLPEEINWVFKQLRSFNSLQL